MLGLDSGAGLGTVRGMAKTETKMRLTPELHAVLTDEAKRKGVSLNALVSIVLTEWVESIARLRDALDKAKGADNGS
jgi:hypothetical protein